MAYTINKTDGTTLTTVADGTVNTSSTSLSIFGKNYSGYGELLNENLVQILENFANTTSPSNVITGQLWFDSSAGILKVYNGSEFKPTGGVRTGTSTPASSNVTGDLFFNTTDDQLYVYDGSSFILVGPLFKAGSGVSGVAVEDVADNLAGTQTIVKIQVGGTNVAVISKTEFTPTDPTLVSTYGTIKKGYNLSSGISNNLYNGTATNAQQLGGVVAANYLRSDTGDTTSGSLTIANDSGLTIGSGSDLSLSIDSASAAVIANDTQDADIDFTINDGGVIKTVMRLDGATSRVGINNTSPTAALDVTGDVVISGTLTAGAQVLSSSEIAGDLTVNGNFEVKGTQTIVDTTNLKVEDPFIVLARNNSTAAFDSGILIERGSSDNQAFFWDESADEFVCANVTTEDGTTTGNVTISSYANLQVGTLTGTATAAQYADLAEMYESDEALEVGDVVEIGGEKEITRSKTALSNKVFGVVSENPAYLMNADAQGGHYFPIALAGKVEIKVTGVVSKGDRLASSAIPGVAQAVADDDATAFNVVARALQDKYNSNTETIMCVINRV
jgi:hypothetical protein